MCVVSDNHCFIHVHTKLHTQYNCIDLQLAANTILSDVSLDDA